MKSLLAREAWLICLVAAPAALAGYLGGSFPLGLAAGVGACLAYYCWQLERLYRWLHEDESSADPPEARGGWAQVFDLLYHQRRYIREERTQLVAAAEYMREALTSISDAVVLVDAAGAIEWCNKAARTLLGLRYPDDQQRLLSNLLRDPEFTEFFQRRDYTDGLDMRSPNLINVFLRCEVTEFGRGNRLLFFRDVTALRQLEQMRVDFIANVSHELRTPLTVISGYLENLEAVPAVMTSPPVARAIQHMRQQSQRMENLVSDLILLSRLESLPVQDTQRMNVAAMARGIVETARIKAGEERTIITDLDDSLLMIGEERELYSAFSNLVHNACKYTPAGGRIEVSWHRREEGGAQFCVADTGIGIDAADIPRLTERFYRVDKGRSMASGGTGLGLAIVKHVLMRHKARLVVESTPGKGSRFCCLFPPESLVETAGD